MFIKIPTGIVSLISKPTHEDALSFIFLLKHFLYIIPHGVDNFLDS
jgi:hypothetical protein